MTFFPFPRPCLTTADASLSLDGGCAGNRASAASILSCALDGFDDEEDENNARADLGTGRGAEVEAAAARAADEDDLRGDRREGEGEARRDTAAAANAAFFFAPGRTCSRVSSASDSELASDEESEEVKYPSCIAAAASSCSSHCNARLEREEFTADEAAAAAAAAAEDTAVRTENCGYLRAYRSTIASTAA